MDNSDIPVFIFNIDSELLFHNASSHSLLELFGLAEKKRLTYATIFNQNFFSHLTENTKLLYIRNVLSGDYYYYQYIPILDDTNKIVGYNIILTDIKAVNEKIKHLETHIFVDGLTGVHNRAFYNLKCREAIRQDQLPLAVFVADIDGLKKINDTFGHSAGDNLIRHCAEIISSSIRRQDLLFRYGGDEYVFYVFNANETGVQRIIAEIQRKNSESPFKYPVSISIGFSILTSLKDSYTDHFLLADAAMYVEKNRKKDVSH